ncbi:hypothetical protein ABKN59_005223 [Abortiporus biennis]
MSPASGINTDQFLSIQPHYSGLQRDWSSPENCITSEFLQGSHRMVPLPPIYCRLLIRQTGTPLNMHSSSQPHSPLSFPHSLRKQYDF